MASTSNHSEEAIVGINVTPLVDVVLVLLVVLMVTATYVASRSIPVDLPRAASGEVQSAPLAVTVDKSGALFFDGAAVKEAELGRRIDSARRARPDVRAVIAADGSVAHRRIVQVIDILRRHQVRHFAINVNPDDLSSTEP